MTSTRSDNDHGGAASSGTAGSLRARGPNAPCAHPLDVHALENWNEGLDDDGRRTARCPRCLSEQVETDTDGIRMAYRYVCWDCNNYSEWSS